MEGARLLITITPPFWKTRWFALVAVLGIIGSTAGSLGIVYQRRIQAQQQAFELETVRNETEHQRQMELERVRIQTQVQTQANERERIFRDIHDGLGANIVEIAAMSEQLHAELDSTQSSVEQQRWASAISASANDLRTSLREIVWLLNMENDTLEALAAYLRQEVRRFLEAASILVHTDIGEECEVPLDVEPEVRRNVVMAVREACGNILKHAAASEVWLAVNLSNGTLSVSVRDNGKGFDPQQTKRFSNGLKTMQKRMDACGGSFRTESAPNQGATMQFRVPLAAALQREELTEK